MKNRHHQLIVTGTHMPFVALIDDEQVYLAWAACDAVSERAQQVKREGRIRCRGCGGESRLRSGKSMVGLVRSVSLRLSGGVTLM